MNVPSEILRCPVTKGPVREMSVAEIAQVNEMVSQGTLSHRDGTPVKREVGSAFASLGGPLVYRMDDGVVTLLEGLAIVCDGSLGGPPSKALATQKESVQAFYDEIGWQRTDDDVFVDTARFVDPRPVVQDYLRKCHLRVARHLAPGGKYLLDVASGPVQFPEYLSYSSGFERRICVDLSVVALDGAKQNVGEKGIYVLGDITNLPFADDTIDGIVSLHTIYHVPRDEQPVAFREVHRVLKPGSSAVVVYRWQKTPWRELSPTKRLVLTLPRAVRRVVRLGRRLTSRNAPSRKRAGAGGHSGAGTVLPRLQLRLVRRPGLAISRRNPGLAKRVRRVSQEVRPRPRSR